jgi:hypothetical protein
VWHLVMSVLSKFYPGKVRFVHGLVWVWGVVWVASCFPLFADCPSLCLWWQLVSMGVCKIAPYCARRAEGH